MVRPDQVHGSGIPHSLRVHGEVRQAPLLLAIEPRGEGYIPRVTYVYMEILLIRCVRRTYIKIIKW